MNVSTVFRGEEQVFSLQDVYHVPDLTDNFVAVSAMTRIGRVIAAF